MARINTSIYFRAYKEDYRKGGSFARLDNSELCTLIKLQAYSNDDGVVCNLDGTGLDFSELTDMLRLNYRTLRKVLISLEQKEFVKVYQADGWIVYLPFYIHNHTEREQSNKSWSQKQAIMRKEAEKKVREAIEGQLSQGIYRMNRYLSRLEEKESKEVAVQEESK